MSTDLSSLAAGIPHLPQLLPLDPTVPHAPVRVPNLSPDQRKLALRNALRYFPSEQHAVLGPEFAAELSAYGHIYMHRYRPTYEMKAYPIDCYPARLRQAAVMQLMIMNNLDPRVAQFPHELVTYGGNGQVFQNWAQYHLVMKYLSEMTDSQTLVLYSGHPMGLFPSSPNGPRCVITNGMMIPRFSTKDLYETLFAQGNTMYGQMTAGSWCYIGPQGIVHGTTITVLNAARKYLKVNDLGGIVYVSSGLGGMSGAQAKAAVIAGAIGVIAETDHSAIRKRHEQGWVNEVFTDVKQCIDRIRYHKNNRTAVSIAYQGNIVDLWEAILQTEDHLVELGSDQTSCHNVFGGGYTPVGYGQNEANELMRTNPQKYRSEIASTLRRHMAVLNLLTQRGGFHFWDYGNSFLLEAWRAGADVLAEGVATANEGVVPEFRYPSYVQHIMGDIFSLGFGPFRWVCTSGDPTDLAKSDKVAEHVLQDMRDKVPEPIKGCVEDNLLWIQRAGENKLVVGSQARILYADQIGRVEIAVALNQAIASGNITAPIVLSRDHHDVSGTDSPFRETSNITDGSNVCADMAVQNVIGDSFRGATWVALHNGGGVGWGEVMNGGFGLVLDGTPEAEARARSMLGWDVSNGVARRAWGGNDNARLAIERTMQAIPDLRVTLAHNTDQALLDSLVE